MGEQLKGKDILESVPLSELAYPKDEALERLYDYTLASARFNYSVLVNHAYQLSPPWPARIRKEVTPEYVDEHIALLPKGGSALIPDDLDTIYENFSSRPFSRLLRYFLKDRIPPLFKDQARGARQPGVVAIGMLTDIARLLQPEKVEPDSIYPFMIKYLRRPEFNKYPALSPFVIGMSLDDTLRLHVGSESKAIIDPRADKLGANAFLEAYLAEGTLHEKEQMLTGLHITLDEIKTLLGKSPGRPLNPFSLN